MRSGLRVPDSLLAVRFWAKVNKTDSCWLWTGAITGGYGSFWIGTGTVRAHRFSYEHLVGPIPDGLVLDHLCRVTKCVNPAHLEPVTTAENVRRGDAPQYLNHDPKVLCKRGHRLDETAYIRRNGARVCHECVKEYDRRRNSQVVHCDVCGKQMRQGSMRRHRREIHGLEN